MTMWHGLYLPLLFYVERHVVVKHMLNRLILGSILHIVDAGSH